MPNENVDVPKLTIKGRVEDFEWLDDGPTQGDVAGAVKYDVGKARMELLPLPALQDVAEVLTFGAAKYADNGWKSLPDAENRYTGALLRHLAAIQAGEEVDPESGLSHISHVACNAIFLTHFHKEKVDGKA